MNLLMLGSQMKKEQQDVRLAQAGDVDAFERLYHAHLPRVHRTARWLLGTNDVDDVIQEVFLRVWDRLETFNGSNSQFEITVYSGFYGYAATSSKQERTTTCTHYNHNNPLSQ